RTKRRTAIRAGLREKLCASSCSALVGALLVVQSAAARRPLPCVPPGASGQVMAAAPTVPFTLPRQSPRQLLQNLLVDLGDRSLIRGRVSGDSDNTYLRLETRGRPSLR